MAEPQTKKLRTEASRAWWKESVVYQIYPSSFKDNNGDGWGDIKGITSKLDYLKDLGVDIIWCSPMFKSPQADMGYDIADYKDMDPSYGTLDDIDELYAELKKRDMKMMMDLVVNHTSDQHPWFLESVKSKDNPKRDWYIWKPPKGTDENGKPEPPNNWAQLLGDANSTWTYSEETGEFYLSLFTPEQPDLNWENPDVRAAVHDIMEFWIARGACGFRMDVINLISKDQTFGDAPQNMPPGHKYQSGNQFYVNGPRLHEFLSEIHDKVLSKHDTITVGEMPGISDPQEILRTVSSSAHELNMIFIFDLVEIDTDGASRLTLKPFTAADIAQILTKWQTTMLSHDGWNSLFVNNHDQPRAVSRYTDDSAAWRVKGAKLLCLMQTTLAGTLYVYQGEELGMRNVPESWDPVTDYKDIESVNFWKKSLELHKGDESGLREARRILQKKSRDNARTPMQWDGSPNAGFCAEGVRPWIGVNEDYEVVNAEAQVGTPGEEHDGGMSVFQFYRRALANRKEHRDVFVYGGYEQVGVECEPEKVYAFVRTPQPGTRDKGFMTVLNFSGEEVRWRVLEEWGVEKWAAGNYGPGGIEKETEGEVVLRPWEGLLGLLKG